MLAINDTIYWAVSCFNYGDDAVFDRQRYGPAWIITSKDGGVTFNETATPTGAPFFSAFSFDGKKPWTQSFAKTGSGQDMNERCFSCRHVPWAARGAAVCPVRPGLRRGTG